MELTGSGYLYTITSLAIYCVAFSVIVVIFKQMLGADISKSQLLLVRLFIKNGLPIASFALLPVLMGLLVLQHPGYED